MMTGGKNTRQDVTTRWIEEEPSGPVIRTTSF